jgi:hypothetical protein
MSRGGESQGSALPGFWGKPEWKKNGNIPNINNKIRNYFLKRYSYTL